MVSDARREWILHRQNLEMRARLPVTAYDELGLDYDCMIAERARRATLETTHG